MYIPRNIDIVEKLKYKSLFLLGPRQTGKTSLLKYQLPEDSQYYDLLDKSLFLRLSSNLSLIREQLEAKNITNQIVVVDEIQKLPELLDEIHLLIEKHNLRFLLTGSSAKKLKQKGVNLLGGRARKLNIHPLVYVELGEENFDLKKCLNRGMIPSIYFSDQPRLDLESYVGTYLDIEIASEASVRDLPAFSRFLSIAALCNGQIINYSSIGNDAAVNRKIVREYFQILFDTQIAWKVPAWNKSKKRKPLDTPKFYFFDTGIVRSILDLPPTKVKSKDFGDFFEAYISHEIKTYLDYHRSDINLCYWRATTNHEVDFIIGDQLGVEVKAKGVISKKDLNGIRACAEEGILKQFFVVSLEESIRKTEDGIVIIPYKEFLQKLWNHELLEQMEEY